MKTIIFIFLSFFFLTSYSQNDSTFTIKIADNVFVPEFSTNSTAKKQYYIRSQKELEETIPFSSRKRMKNIDFTKADLVGINSCEQCFDYINRKYSLTVVKKNNNYTFKQVKAPLEKHKCINARKWYLIKKIRNDRITCNTIIHTEKISSKTPMFIDDEILLNKMLKNSNISLDFEVDFNKHTIIFIEIAGDCHAVFDFDVIINKNNKTYNLLIYNYYGGCTGLNFFKYLILAPKIPKNYKFNKTNILADIDMYLK